MLLGFQVHNRSGKESAKSEYRVVKKRKILRKEIRIMITFKVLWLLYLHAVA
jgi:hypothetical protein